MRTLLLTALTLLPLAAQAPAPRPGHARLAKALDLSPDQQTKLKALRASHQEAMAPKRQAAQEARAALAKALQDPKASEASLKALHTRAAEAHFQLLLAGRAHRAEVNALLTPEQREKVAAFQAARHEHRKGRARLMRMALRD